jgi:hypothetical protein
MPEIKAVIIDGEAGYLKRTGEKARLLGLASPVK